MCKFGILVFGWHFQIVLTKQLILKADSVTESDLYYDQYEEEQC